MADTAENKMFTLKVENDKLIADLDTNKDGEAVVKLELSLKEAMQEIFNKGVEVQGVKVAAVKFEMTKLKVVLDTDKDGENLLTLTVDLGEVFDEVTSLLQKK